MSPLRFILALLFALTLGTAAYAKEPDKVFIGAYVNDIQNIDLHTDSYHVDLYVWFRWKNPALDPSKSAEFMNTFAPAEHVHTMIYDKPQKMPDGSLYNVFRHQGRFNGKFALQRYPFDKQDLAVSIEDTVHPASEMVFVPDDKAAPLTLSAKIRLQGFNIGAPAVAEQAFPYDTNFGDLTQKDNTAYSRVTFAVPVERPVFNTGIKVFLPVLLIILCTALVLFVHPAYIEGRLGVAITALLTLVALQLTSASGLPEADYLLMADKVYMLSYLFIIATLTQVVRTSRLVQAGRHDAATASDRGALYCFIAAFAGGIFVILLTTFTG
ncbi:MAG: hypothetical protein ACAH80_06395 [Alphaproteobacteria bacterium]